MYTLRTIDPKKIRRATDRFWASRDHETVNSGYIDVDGESNIDIPVVPCFGGPAKKRILIGGIVCLIQTGELFRVIDIEWRDSETPANYMAISLRTSEKQELHPGACYYLPKLWIKYLEEEMGVRVNAETTDHPICPICGSPQTYFRGAPACGNCNIFHNIGESGNGLWLKIDTLELAYDPREDQQWDDDIPF
ncbi:MAG: hypothetical protein GXP63_02355 [DPANN group archaeon]|nr:hypothetical protein [DPANN group archaeon]